MASEFAYSARSGSRRTASLDELARRQGVGPIMSVDQLARDDVFESDRELDEFVAFIGEFRRSEA